MFKTVADVLARIHEEGRTDLLGPRTRGSTSENGLDAIPSNRRVTEFTPEDGKVAGCRYFVISAPEIRGKLGALPFRRLTPEQRSMVKIRDTYEHGLELYLDRPDDGQGAPTGAVTVIVGPNSEGTDIIYTWHPGPVMSTITELTGNLTPSEKAGPLMEGVSLANVAVKLHNGT